MMHARSAYTLEGCGGRHANELPGGKGRGGARLTTVATGRRPARLPFPLPPLLVCIPAAWPLVARIPPFSRRPPRLATGARDGRGRCVMHVDE